MGDTAERRGPGEGSTFVERARREQITELAIELIARHGYARTSLARIAEAAEVSNAAVLYHFGSKRAVLESASAKVIGAVSASVGLAMERAGSGAAAVEAYIRALVGYFAAHPTHTRLLIEVLTADAVESERDPEVVAAPPPRWAPLAAAMEQGQREGELRSFDTRTYAIALGGAIDGIFAESLADPAFDLDGAVDDLVELVRRATVRSSSAG